MTADSALHPPPPTPTLAGTLERARYSLLESVSKVNISLCSRRNICVWVRGRVGGSPAAPRARSESIATAAVGPCGQGLGEGVEDESVCKEARSANAPTQFTCFIDEFNKLA